MAGHRIVVGASGDDSVARRAARRLRDEGHEVVFVGGGQTPDHLARTAIAEDTARIVVDADDEVLSRTRESLAGLGVTDVDVSACDQSDAHHP